MTDPRLYQVLKLLNQQEKPKPPEMTSMFGGGMGGFVSDAPYSSAWDGDTKIAPSKNAVYDKVESLADDAMLWALIL